MLLETQLQFEAWLKLPELDVYLVERAKTKVKEYMNMSKMVGKREKGMGCRTMNHHGTKHVPDQILDMGVNSNVNTTSNESHHKADKKTAQRTNKRPGTFDIMVATKIQERTAVALAIEETYGRKRWHYYRGNFDHNDRFTNESSPFEPTLTGVRMNYWRKQGDTENEYLSTIYSSMKYKHKYRYDQMTTEGIQELVEFLLHDMDLVTLYSELKLYDKRANNNRQTYRACPYYEGFPWHDWAIFDLSRPDGTGNAFTPAQIKCIVDLTNLPADNSVNYEPGIYALCEEARLNIDPKEFNKSELFEAWVKDEANLTGCEKRFNKLRLLHTKLLVAPTIMFPDLDNENERAYLRMIPRATWGDLFNEWLKHPHRREFDDDQKM